MYIFLFYFTGYVGLWPTLFVDLLIEMPNIFLHSKIPLIILSSALFPSRLWDYLFLCCIPNTYEIACHCLSVLFPMSHNLVHWIILITRYHAENRNITLGEFKFGPLFMRLCYELDLEESAVELIKDQVIVFWLLSLPMWFPCASDRVFLMILGKHCPIHIIIREGLLGQTNELFPPFLRFPWSQFLWCNECLFIQRCRTDVEEV